MSKSTLQQAAMEAARRLALRRFAGDSERETKVQDAISLAWEFSLRAPEAATPSTVARFAVRKVTANRQFPESVRSADGGKSRCRDKPQRTGLDVGQLARLGDDPAAIAQVRHDAAVWWSRLSPRKRQMAEALALGYTTKETAEMLGCTAGAVSQTRRLLWEAWESL